MSLHPRIRRQEHLFAPFGNDTFGRAAERAARFFGTAAYIIGQSIIVAIWILLNIVAVSLRWDPYPFILLNLAFSTQAAYAAPLILLAQNRAAERDKQAASTLAEHNEKLASNHAEALAKLDAAVAANTALTEEVRNLTEQVHALVQPPPV